MLAGAPMEYLGRKQTMKIGIGLPTTIPGVRGELALDWARRADAGPFSSLGVTDRLVYPGYDVLIALAAAAAVTRRIRLMTTVLLAPLRNAAVLAKQAATIDVLSGGRFTLGVGIGGREDDFRAASVPFRSRGRRLAEQLALMKRIWSGQPVSEDIGPVGPPPVQPGGPEVLIGGYSPAAMRRVGRWADGYISGGSSDVQQIQQLYRVAEESWQAAGRPGKPRLVAAIYYGLGPNARERAAVFIRNYYAFIGPRVEGMVQNLPAAPETIRAIMSTFADIGVDELICWPCIPELDQIDRLADLVG